ncbi:putative methyltransferase, YaeB/AF_0241 family [Acinetobacter baumannii]|nr:putative methyltransferase, YaeB/AF_0241 family [Acinetobacter baumannii]
MWSENALSTQQSLFKNKEINAQYLDELEQVLSLDPRPAYQEDPERVYKMKFSNFDIHFKVNGNVITVVDMVKDTSLV